MSSKADELRKKMTKFQYALLTCTLFMSQVPCDSSYDKEMAKLLGKVREAHDEEIALLKVAHPQALKADKE